MARAKKFAEIKNAKTGETLMQMFGPRAENDAVSVGLRILTHQLQLREPEKHHAGGFFGGSFGYAVEFSNDVFTMCPDYQDCTCAVDNPPPHTGECKATIDQWNEARRNSMIVPETDAERQEYEDTKRKVDAGEVAPIELLALCGRPMDFAACFAWEEANPFPPCSCGALAAWTEPDDHEPLCSLVRPRFLHVASGLRVDWYKYIGRDMELSNKKLTGAEWKTVLSDCLASLGISLDAAFAAYQEAEREEAERFKRSNDFMFTAQAK